MGNFGFTQMTYIERLAALRGELAHENLDGVLIPRGDDHLSEYVPACAERLAWISGFTGSAGMAVVLKDRALIWSDGRYVLQLAEQTDGALWQRLHLTDAPPAKYLAENAPAARIGYDPWLMAQDTVDRFTQDGVTMIAVGENLIDRIWHDRPAAPLDPAMPHGLDFSGETTESKRDRIAAILRADKLDTAIITDPASLAWLLNIRGTDVDCTPFALGFVVLHADGTTDLFMAPEKLPPNTRAWLGNHVAIHDRAALTRVLAQFGGKRVRVDTAGSAAWFSQTLRAAGATIVPGSDPCAEPRARKNTVEQNGARAAHAMDGVALCRFLHWFASNGIGQTEISVGEKLQEFRALNPLCRGDSFPAITGAGEHGAVIHYHATPDSNRDVRANEVFLIDSGGQYFAGTTDVTRTLWTGPNVAPAILQDRFTLVLKGHIAIATLVFPDNCAGVRIDAFARASLWQAGLDYDHGTGHGVGSYLSVHEGPVSISPHLRPAGIRAGMILSNEPGYYLPGAYGIRLENLLLTQPAGITSEKPFLGFEILTLAPFERSLIDVSLLTPAEQAWIDRYHARVLADIGPHLPADEQAWLTTACAPLHHSEQPA